MHIKELVQNLSEVMKHNVRIEHIKRRLSTICNDLEIKRVVRYSTETKFNGELIFDFRKDSEWLNEIALYFTRMLNFSEFWEEEKEKIMRRIEDSIRLFLNKNDSLLLFDNSLCTVQINDLYLNCYLSEGLNQGIKRHLSFEEIIEEKISMTFMNEIYPMFEGGTLSNEQLKMIEEEMESQVKEVYSYLNEYERVKKNVEKEIVRKVSYLFFEWNEEKEKNRERMIDLIENYPNQLHLFYV